MLGMKSYQNHDVLLKGMAVAGHKFQSFIVINEWVWQNESTVLPRKYQQSIPRKPMRTTCIIVLFYDDYVAYWSCGGMTKFDEGPALWRHSIGNGKFPSIAISHKA